MSDQNKQDDEQNKLPSFTLEKIYLRDLSFESPRPIETLVKPVDRADINFQLNTEIRKPAEDVYEVTLVVTVTALKEKVALYLVEVKQAGLFTLRGFPEEELKAMLNVACPNMLFPYAREVISNMVERGGYPQMLLKPMNFDAIYTQHIEQQTQEKKANA